MQTTHKWPRIPGFSIHVIDSENIQLTSHFSIQALNKKCICLFEDCTRLVSICGLFSANESFTEIPTNDLKYLLLPFFLGTLSQKICGGLRTDIVDVAESYFQWVHI